MTTIELLKEYLNAYFVERRPEKLLALMDESVHGYGFPDDWVMENAAQARQLAEERCKAPDDRLELEIWEETPIS